MRYDEEGGGFTVGVLKKIKSKNRIKKSYFLEGYINLDWRGGEEGGEVFVTVEGKVRVVFDGVNCDSVG